MPKHIYAYRPHYTIRFYIIKFCQLATQKQRERRKKTEKGERKKKKRGQRETSQDIHKPQPDRRPLHHGATHQPPTSCLTIAAKYNL